MTVRGTMNKFGFLFLMVMGTAFYSWKEFADGGNGERMTFVFDKRKVWFKNIAGEIVLSRTKLISENIELEDGVTKAYERQFSRTPFLVSFQSGWFRFDVCTVHIYFGAESGEKLKRRIKEIDSIANSLTSVAI